MEPRSRALHRRPVRDRRRRSRAPRAQRHRAARGARRAALDGTRRDPRAASSSRRRAPRAARAVLHRPASPSGPTWRSASAAKSTTRAPSAPASTRRRTSRASSWRATPRAPSSGSIVAAAEGAEAAFAINTDLIAEDRPSPERRAHSDLDLDFKPGPLDRFLPLIRHCRSALSIDGSTHLLSNQCIGPSLGTPVFGDTVACPREGTMIQEIERQFVRTARPLVRPSRHLFESAIARGELPSGSRLPPERELAQRLRISRTTVVSAYRELESRGLLRGYVGRGTFVCAAPEPTGTPFAWRGKIASAALRTSDSTLRDAIRHSSDARLLSLAAGEPAIDCFPDAAFQQADRSRADARRACGAGATVRPKGNRRCAKRSPSAFGVPRRERAGALRRAAGARSAGALPDRSGRRGDRSIGPATSGRSSRSAPPARS